MADEFTVRQVELLRHYHVRQIRVISSTKQTVMDINTCRCDVILRCATTNFSPVFPAAIT